MQLDIPTLMVMGSFVAACSGAILLGGWWTNRKVPALALWGISSLLSAAGIASLMLGPVLREPSFLIVGGNLLTLAHGLIWQGARAIDSKPAPTVVALLGTAILIVVGLAPAARPIIAPLGFAINVIYVVAGAISLWLCRQEQLPARWPLIGLLVVHAVVVASGVHFTLHLAEALDQVPPLMSLFGMIHFESIVFSIGTAAFLMALVIERREAATKVAATTDPLTGIANRAAFVKVAGRVLERCRQDGAPVSMIMFDLDRFKSVNDTFGHATGDAVIQKFCAVAAAALRPTDLFGRIGGEEFAVIMPRSSIEAAYIRADRIRASFAEQCRTVGSNAVKATVSGGVAASANAGLSLSDLLEYSDQALYSAKASGRNRVKLAEPKAVLGEGVPAVIRVA